MTRYVHAEDAVALAARLPHASVDLLLFDPPYFGITKEAWDNQWASVDDYVAWFVGVMVAYLPKLAPRASVVFFGGIGAHGARPLFKVMDAIESADMLHYRNMITWGKRRAYGKSHDYLFTREEIVWYSVSSARTEVTFNVPYLDEKRGYAGFNAKYPAKSEYKRVSNVWTDITELFRPERYCQKPLPLMERLVATHSNAGDLVVDPFAGWGTTGVAALGMGRRFVGSEALIADADAADARCRAAAKYHEENSDGPDAA